MKNLRYIIYLLLLASCAQVVVPDGGAKDTTPPVILLSSPGNFATGFSGTQIRMQFDEYVQMKNEQTQVIVSPSLGNMKYRIRGKSLYIDFDSIPKPETTYIINFGEAIVDFNEGNPLDSNLFVFSTGFYIDSLEINGRIESAGDNKVQKGVLVMLYSDLNDSVPYKIKPDYVTRTDANGLYTLSYLKPGTYKMMAMLDMNSNFLFDDPEKERIGFVEEPVILTRDTVINFSIFKEAPAEQRLKSAGQVRNKLIQFVFALPVDSFRVSIDRDELARDTFVLFHSDRDTISLFMPNLQEKDTFELIYSVPGLPEDTQRITPVLNPGRMNKISRDEFTVSLLQETNKKVPSKDSFRLVFNTPVYRVDSSLINLHKAKDTLSYQYRLENNSKELVILADLETDTLYNLNLLPGAITDVTRRTHDTLNFAVRPNPEEYYGNLSVKPVVPDTIGQYILILEKTNGQEIGRRIFESTSSFSFRRLAPGTYTLKLVIDENENGRWDTGNYREKRQPERVILYSGGISVKSNWDQEFDWEVFGGKKGSKTR